VTRGAAPYLRTREEIGAFADEARADGRFALDVEFIRERTFFPQLALVQVATTRRAALIDPLADVDLSPIDALVLDPAVMKVLHAASQDLEIFFYRTGEAPRRIFDTQIAGSLAGLGHQCSYGAMIERTLGISLAKGESYTDWLRRPLSPKQEQYALDDVRPLLAAHDRLAERLREKGRLSWAEEELRRYEEKGAYETPPELLFRRVKRFGTLDGRSLAVLRELAIWRDEEARSRDKPRRSIVPDEALVELARGAPQSVDDLSRQRGLDPREAKRSGRALLAAIAAGLAVPAADRPDIGRKDRLTPEAEAMVDILQAVLRALCRAEEVAPPIVASGDDVENLVRDHFDGGVHTSECALLTGWRRELVGDELVRFVEGKVGIHLDPKTGAPVFDDR
jgi:ribonuclease D